MPGNYGNGNKKMKKTNNRAPSTCANCRNKAQCRAQGRCAITGQRLS